MSGSWVGWIMVTTNVEGPHGGSKHGSLGIYQVRRSKQLLSISVSCLSFALPYAL